MGFLGENSRLNCWGNIYKKLSYDFRCKDRFGDIIALLSMKLLQIAKHYIVKKSEHYTKPHIYIEVNPVYNEIGEIHRGTED